MIHPTAIVDPGARIGANVAIGPYSIIGPDVEIGDNTEVGPHVVIKGHTRIGRDNHIFQFCSLGEIPQDKKYAGEPTRLEIGDRNTIREFCTFNLGTVQGGGLTSIGDDNWIMVFVISLFLAYAFVGPWLPGRWAHRGAVLRRQGAGAGRCRVRHAHGHRLCREDREDRRQRNSAAAALSGGGAAGRIARPCHSHLSRHATRRHRL